MTACWGAPSIRSVHVMADSERERVCVPQCRGQSQTSWSTASSQSESDIVTELQGKCVEWGCYYWMGAICYATSEYQHTQAHNGFPILYFNTHFHHETGVLVYCKTRCTSDLFLNCQHFQPAKRNVRIWGLFLNRALKTIATRLWKWYHTIT